MKNNLIQVVERGTAKEARIPGTALAAKTGTAEIKLSHDDVTGTELGWFVMFNADENTSEPLLVATMVEDVKKRGGSHYAIPMVKTLFE
jgi:penicillin-binding protein